MKQETKDEWVSVFKDGWPLFLECLVGGFLVGYFFL